MADVIVENIEAFGLTSETRPKQLFSKVGIIGCGRVGQEIALMILQKELEVVFIELSEERIAAGICRIERELDNLINNWGMTPSEKRAILSRVQGYTDYSKIKDCDLVIESIRSDRQEERIEVRKEVFKKIEAVISPDCIIASNSITLVITELAAELEHKERCVSLHFLTNAPNSKMIEVVKGLYTSDVVYDRVLHFIKMLGKEAILVEESPGLISIRVFVAQLNEACQVLMEGISSVEDIDKTMRIGFGQILGPFEMADKIGLDKVLNWMDNLYSEFGDVKFKASPVIRRHVRAKQLGRITNKGFYTYES